MTEELEKEAGITPQINKPTFCAEVERGGSGGYFFDGGAFGGGALIGYARVSKTDGSQSLDLQRDALWTEGIDAVHVYHDCASGVRDDRPGLDSLDQPIGQQMQRPPRAPGGRPALRHGEQLPLPGRGEPARPRRLRPRAPPRPAAQFGRPAPLREPPERDWRAAVGWARHSVLEPVTNRPDVQIAGVFIERNARSFWLSSLWLSTSLNIAPPGWEQTYDPLVEACTLDKGWSRPDDPARARDGV